METSEILSFETFIKNFYWQTKTQNEGNKYHAILFYFSPYELGYDEEENYNANNSNNDSEDFILKNIRYFTDGALALSTYTNIHCPASQLLSEETLEGLYNSIIEMMHNFKDKEYLNKYVYPYL